MAAEKGSLNRKLRRLRKMIRFIGYSEREAILEGTVAKNLSPEKDKESKDHHQIFFREGKFQYWSAEESRHNGDYYDDFHAELPMTEALLDACLKNLEPEALNVARSRVKREEEIRMERKAKNWLTKVLR